MAATNVTPEKPVRVLHHREIWDAVHELTQSSCVLVYRFPVLISFVHGATTTHGRLPSVTDPSLRGGRRRTDPFIEMAQADSPKWRGAHSECKWRFCNAVFLLDGIRLIRQRRGRKTNRRNRENAMAAKFGTGTWTRGRDDGNYGARDRKLRRRRRHEGRAHTYTRTNHGNNDSVGMTRTSNLNGRLQRKNTRALGADDRSRTTTD